MDIVVWQRSLGLEEYEEAFRDNKIDERVLPKSEGNRRQGDRRVQLRDICATECKKVTFFWAPPCKALHSFLDKPTLRYVRRSNRRYICVEFTARRCLRIKHGRGE